MTTFSSSSMMGSATNVAPPTPEPMATGHDEAELCEDEAPQEVEEDDDDEATAAAAADEDVEDLDEDDDDDEEHRRPRRPAEKKKKKMPSRSSPFGVPPPPPTEEEDEEEEEEEEEDEEDLDEIAALIDRLKAPSSTQRAASNRALPRIAKALGPDRSRDELVPFLCENADDADDVLAAMAESLGKLINLVSGGPSCLLAPLEALLCVEESTVRDAAVASALQVGGAMDDVDVARWYLPFARRLASHDWFTGRMASCRLFAKVLFRRNFGVDDDSDASPETMASSPSSRDDDAMSSSRMRHTRQDATRARREARRLFAALCTDDTPMVRRVAAANLGDVVEEACAAWRDATRTARRRQHADFEDEDAQTVVAAHAKAAKGPSWSASQDGPVSSSSNHSSSKKSLASSLCSQEVEELVALFRGLADDDQDAVRLQTAANCVAVARALGALSEGPTRGEQQHHPTAFRTLWGGPEAAALPVLLAAAGDRSWRVRWSVAAKFADAAQALATTRITDADDDEKSASGLRRNTKRCASELCAAFVDLLNDVEAEVRAAAAKNAGRVAASLNDPETALSSLVPSVETLACDASPLVRAALASALGGLARTVGKVPARTRVFPVALRLLRDHNSEVRLNVISNLGDVHRVVGDDLVSDSLVPAVVELADDPKWRVRAAVIRHVPVVAAQFTTTTTTTTNTSSSDDDDDLDDDVRHQQRDTTSHTTPPQLLFEQFALDQFALDERLCRSCVAWLSDDVAAIRDLAAENLRALASLFGAEWAKTVGLPDVVLEMCKHKSYLRRVTAAKTAANLADVVPRRDLAEYILPAILSLASDDPVPNVRFNAAKATIKLADALKSNTHRHGSHAAAAAARHNNAKAESSSSSVVTGSEERRRRRRRREGGEQPGHDGQQATSHNGEKVLQNNTTMTNNNAASVPPPQNNDDDDDDGPLATGSSDKRRRIVSDEDADEADDDYARLVDDAVLPCLDRLLADADADVRAFATDARNAILGNTTTQNAVRLAPGDHSASLSPDDDEHDDFAVVAEQDAAAAFDENNNHHLS